MNNYQRSQLHRSTSYAYTIDERPYRGGGYSFSCDKYGNILEEQMGPGGWISFYLVFEEIYSGKWGTPYVQEYRSSYLQPAEGDCACGTHIVLYDAMTNECVKCGSLYNGGGQLLAPRSQWEELYDEEPGLFTGEDITMMSGY